MLGSLTLTHAFKTIKKHTTMSQQELTTSSVDNTPTNADGSSISTSGHKSGKSDVNSLLGMMRDVMNINNASKTASQSKRTSSSAGKSASSAQSLFAALGDTSDDDDGDDDDDLNQFESVVYLAIATYTCIHTYTGRRG